MNNTSLDTLVLENGEYRTIIPDNNRKKIAQDPSGRILRSVIPGTVISVCVVVGQHVKQGDLLYVLDSMKMNNRICASKDGVVAALFMSVGDSVTKDAPMVEFE